MRESHANFGINDHIYNVFLKHLRQSLYEIGVQEEIAFQITEATDLTRDQVIGRY